MGGHNVEDGALAQLDLERFLLRGLGQPVERNHHLVVQRQLVAIVEHDPLEARQGKGAVSGLVVLTPGDGAHRGLALGNLLHEGLGCFSQLRAAEVDRACCDRLDVVGRVFLFGCPHAVAEVAAQ